MVATLDWYGCATFRLRTAGLTIFLDAYIDRVVRAAGPGLTADQIADDDWLPGFSIDTDVKPIRDELARVVPGAELVELGYVDGTEILPVR